MNSDNIIISIIIPCYNDGRFLPEAVQSVEKNQTGRHEIIIVNDGSNDPATLDVLAAIEKRGHRVLHQQNLGLGAARNRGVAQARGRYILTLDADNRIRPAYIDRGIEILDREPAIDVVYGDSENFGDQIGRNRVADFNFDRLLAWNFIDACAVFRKQAWERCGGYDEHMPHQGFEDWDFWCRIACSGGGFVHVDEVLYDYRKRKDSMSSQMDTPVRMTAILDHMRKKERRDRGRLPGCLPVLGFFCRNISPPSPSNAGKTPVKSVFSGLVFQKTSPYRCKTPSQNHSHVLASIKPILMTPIF